MSTTKRVHECLHCGIGHVGKCPRIKAEEYYPDGTIKRVEFHEPQPIVSATAINPLDPRFISGESVKCGVLENRWPE